MCEQIVMIGKSGAQLIAPQTIHDIFWLAATSQLSTAALRTELVKLSRLMNWADIEAAIKEQ